MDISRHRIVIGSYGRQVGGALCGTQGVKRMLIGNKGVGGITSGTSIGLTIISGLFGRAYIIIRGVNGAIGCIRLDIIFSYRTQQPIFGIDIFGCTRRTTRGLGDSTIGGELGIISNSTGDVGQTGISIRLGKTSTGGLTRICIHNDRNGVGRIRCGQRSLFNERPYCHTIQTMYIGDNGLFTTAVVNLDDGHRCKRD